MKIVIDIPDEWKTRIEHNRRPNTIECGELVESVWKGKILPKDHGRLIDADALEVSIYREAIKYQYINEFSPDEPVYEYTNYYRYKTIENAPTIIEADKEAEDEGCN